MPVWAIVPPLRALNWWSPSSAQLATSPCNYTLNSGKTLGDWAKVSSSFSYLLLPQNQQVQPSSWRPILIPSGPSEILALGNEFSITVSEIWGLLSGRWLVPRARDSTGCRMPTGLGKNHAYCFPIGTTLFVAKARLPDYQLDLPGRLTVPSAHHACAPRSPLSGHTNTAAPYRRILADGND